MGVWPRRRSRGPLFRRIAALAVGVLAMLVLSGCDRFVWEVFGGALGQLGSLPRVNQGFCDIERDAILASPPPYNHLRNSAFYDVCVWNGYWPAGPERTTASARKDAAGARSGRPFTMTLSSFPSPRFPPTGTSIKRRGSTLYWRGISLLGLLRGRLGGSGRARPAEAVLAQLLKKTSYAALLNASRSLRTHKVVVQGLTVAPVRLAGTHPTQVCLRLTVITVRGRRPTGTFTVLGGTDKAATLHARGKFSVTAAPDGSARLRGRVVAFAGAKRAMPRACRKTKAY